MILNFDIIFYFFEPKNLLFYKIIVRSNYFLRFNLNLRIQTTFIKKIFFNLYMEISKNYLLRKFLPFWEIPDFEISYLKEKRNKYVLIIPVINEGQNIINFVNKISFLKINQIIDILIMDGGSIDNSLNPENLRVKGINGLLIKKGPGKLGSQLRIAYARSLVMGYEGVITIDGNNKDQPQAIKDFIHLLDKGYDFVQGSRFVKNGKHVNTPLLRYLGIRLIHAPLLSIASNFRWTDTTQGFRGYSRRLIESNKICLFRNIFKNYEMLAYLSYICPKEDFRCIEIPTSRIYPKGKIPTKISPLRGEVNVMITLFRACLGYYSI